MHRRGLLCKVEIDRSGFECRLSRTAGGGQVGAATDAAGMAGCVFARIVRGRTAIAGIDGCRKGRGTLVRKDRRMPEIEEDESQHAEGAHDLQQFPCRCSHGVLIIRFRARGLAAKATAAD